MQMYIFLFTPLHHYLPLDYPVPNYITFALLMTREDYTHQDLQNSTMPVWYRLNLTYAGDTNRVMPLPYALPDSTTEQTSGRFFTTTDSHILHLPVPREHTDRDWQYGSFILILIMIVLLRVIYPNQVNNMLRSLIFPGKPSTVARVFEFRFNMYFILFFFIFSMTYGLMLYSLLERFRWGTILPGTMPVILFFGLSLAFALLIILKILMIRVSGRIFSTWDISIIYQDHLLISTFLSSAAIIPLIVINTFSSSNVFLFAAIAFVIVFFITRSIRIFSIGFGSATFSCLHFILYFCTLEILPMLIMGKIITILLMKGEGYF